MQDEKGLLIIIIFVGSLLFGVLIASLFIPEWFFDNFVWARAPGVNSILGKKDRVCIGGKFFHVNKFNTKGFAIVDVNDGKYAYVKNDDLGGEGVIINGDDGNIYIGGKEKISRIVNGYVDEIWMPVKGQILCMYFNDGVLYVGGEFQEIGGQARKSLAAIDIIKGKVTDLNNKINRSVRALIVCNDKLIIGGHFNKVDDNLRLNIASIDLKTRKITSWSPTINNNSNPDIVISHNYRNFSNVACLSRSDRYLIAGGMFSNVDSFSRKNIVVFDIDTGYMVGLSPNADGIIYTMISSENKLFIGGAFKKIMEKEMKYIAAIDLNKNELMNFNPKSDGVIYSLSLFDKVLYVGGKFNSIGGEKRHNIAAISAGTGLASNWEPNLSSFRNF